MKKRVCDTCERPMTIHTIATVRGSLTWVCPSPSATPAQSPRPVRQS